MGVFRDAEHLYGSIGGLFEWAGTQEKIRKDLHATGLVIRLSHTEPEATITINCRSPEVPVHFGPAGPQPDVEFRMKADVAHRFWLGRVNLLVALSKKDIVARGPVMKVMKILPALKPLYEHYPKHLKSRGDEALAR